MVLISQETIERSSSIVHHVMFVREREERRREHDTLIQRKESETKTNFGIMNTLDHGDIKTKNYKHIYE
jgi:hypothetical protein